MWGAPYEPGYCVLDGVRAALSSERIGFPRRLASHCGGTPAAGWSSSSGKLATHRSTWAPRDHPSAACQPNAGLTAASGWFTRVGDRRAAALYPALGRVIREHANEEGLALLRQLETMTTAGAVIRMAR